MNQVNHQPQTYQNQNFRGQTISHKKFCGCDIRGADFTDATLENVDFTGAKAGLSPHSQKLLLIGIFILNSVCISVLGMAGQKTGDSIIKLFQEQDGSSNDRIGLTLWSALVIGVMFITSIRSLPKGVIPGFKQTTGAGLILIALAIAHSLLQAFPRMIDHHSVDTINGYMSRLIIQTMNGVITGSALLIVAGIVTVAAAAAHLISGVMTQRLMLWGSLVFTTATGVSPLLGGMKDIWIGWGTTAIAVWIARDAALRVRSNVPEFENVRQFAVAIAAYGGTSFHKATLTNVVFTNATLNNTDFRAATIKRVCWKDSLRLEDARLDDTILAFPKVRQLLVKYDGKEKDFQGCNLKGANLAGANLRYANFTDADLSGANLAGANLSYANLTEAQAISTDFQFATMTGVHLKSWNTDGNTKLNGVRCKFIIQDNRIPLEGRDFKPGEFTTLFQKARNVVELIFQDGVSWVSFAFAMGKLEIESEDSAAIIKGIDDRDGVTVVSITLPDSVDRTKWERKYWEGYETAKKELAPFYERQLEANRQSTNELIKLIQDKLFQEHSELIKQMSEQKPSQITNNINQVAALLQNSDGGQMKVTQINLGANEMPPLLELLQQLDKDIQNFPKGLEDQRDEAKVYLDHLRAEVESPERRNPQNIKAYMKALAAIAAAVGATGTFMANGVDFADKVVDLGKKVGVKIEYPQITPQYQSAPPAE